MSSSAEIYKKAPSDLIFRFDTLYCQGKFAHRQLTENILSFTQKLAPKCKKWLKMHVLSLCY